MSGAWGCRIRTARLIASRGLKAALYGPGLYLMVTAVCILSALVTHTYAGSINEEGLMVTSNPLSSLLYLVLTIEAVYLAITASISISRERDSGTMEVLFYGPVDTVSYVVGKFLEEVLKFAAMLLPLVAVLAIFGTLTNFGFSLDLALSIALSLGVASSVTAFGIVLSSATRRIRTSVLTLVALLVVFLGVQWGDSFVSGLDPQAIPPALAYARSVLSFAARCVGWISPFAQMSRGMQAIAVGDAVGYGVSFACSLGYSAALLVLSVLSLRRKGVRA